MAYVESARHRYLQACWVPPAPLTRLRSLFAAGGLAGWQGRRSAKGRPAHRPHVLIHGKGAAAALRKCTLPWPLAAALTALG